MAATTIRELLVAIGIKADEKALKRFDAALEHTKKAMGSLASGAKWAALGIGALGASLGTAITKIADYGGELDDAASRTGVNVEALQELQWSAKLAGASVEDLEGALSKQAQSSQDAIAGSKSAVAAYKKLGISSEKLKNLSQDQLFEEIAGGLAGITSEAEQIDLTKAIFGKGGTALLPMLKQGKAGIQAQRKEAKKLGVLTEDQIKTMAEFGDQLDRVKRSFLGLATGIGAELIPVLEPVVQGFLDWFEVNREIIQQRVEVVFERITRQIKELGRQFEKFSKFIEDTIGWEAALQLVAGAALAVVAAFGAFKVGGPIYSGLLAAYELVMLVGAAFGVGFAPALGIIALVTAAIGLAVVNLTALALVMEDVNGFLTNTKDTMIGAFVDSYAKSKGPLGFLARTLLQLRDIAQANRRIFMAWLDILGNDFTIRLRAAQKAIEWFIGALSSLYEWLSGTTAFQMLASAAKAAFDVISAALSPIIKQISWIIDAIQTINPASYLQGLAGDLESIARAQEAMLMSGSLADKPGDKTAYDTTRIAMGAGAVGISPIGVEKIGNLGGAKRLPAPRVQQSVQIAVNGAGDPNAVGAAINSHVTRERRQALSALEDGEL